MKCRIDQPVSRNCTRGKLPPCALSDEGGRVKISPVAVSAPRTDPAGANRLLSLPRGDPGRQLYTCKPELERLYTRTMRFPRARRVAYSCKGEVVMIQECDICGVELNPHETEGVCLLCQKSAHYECPRCGAVMPWRDREHLLCKACRHENNLETVTDGKY